MSLRETVQFMCEMKIKVNIQRIHSVKQINLITKEECENKMIGEIFYPKYLYNWMNYYL